ncbi:hypothetical protein REPUB_Repub14bG0116500 [Reevesia pubescens]
MASWRFLACLMMILHSVSRSQFRLLNPNNEGRNPTRSNFRMFSFATTSRKVYWFNIQIRDEYKNENLYELKHLSPEASRSESRLINPYNEGRNPNRAFRALSITASPGKVYQFRIPLTDEHTKNLYESKRLNPGGPDPKHH